MTRLNFPWPGRNWRGEVIGRVAKAGFPRFERPVSVTVNAHPPTSKVRTPEDVGERVADALVNAMVAPEVAHVTVVTRGMIRGGALLLTIEENGQ